MSSCFTIFLSVLFFFINVLSTESAPTYLYHYCTNATLFSPNSTYKSNLNTLLSSLSAAATNDPDGFANATVGQNPPNRAYGIFLCRGDVSNATCSDCVATGTKEILQRCPDQRVSVIWYDECMLRYSNASIYSVMEQGPALTMLNTGNITDPTRFMQLLGQTTDDVATRASADESGKKVAVNVTDFTSLQKLYTLAQCTPDLTAADCNTCLRTAIADLPDGKQGGRTFTPSCSVRFELYPFYNASAVEAPAPPPSQIPSPPPAPTVRPNALQSSTIYSITASRPLVQNQTLVSRGQIFELGFFTPNGSARRYLGIWYKKLTPSRVVWVANRNKPLGHTDQSASLIIGEDGNLKLLDGQQNTVWSTNVMAKSNNSAALLSDYGNFLLRDREANIMWESFDEPTDTLLPNMKIGVNVKTGKKLNLISWKGEDDPSFGSFVVGLTSETAPQLFTWHITTPYWRSGQWDKTKFIGIPTMDNTISGVHQDNVQGTSYYSINNYNNMFFGYTFISSEGLLKSVVWATGWITNWKAPTPTNPCEIYGICGPFGVCNPSSSPICGCFQGFKPRSDEEWNRGNWTRGCLREMELSCQNHTTAVASTTVGKDIFWKMKQIKLPDSADYVLMDNAEGCRSWCLENCSCLAFSYVNAIGCMAWSQDLLDTQQFSFGGEDLFIRLVDAGKSNKATVIIIAVAVPVGVGMVLLFLACCFRRRKATKTYEVVQEDQSSANYITNAESLQYDLATIQAATDNFSLQNKLGEGGFGEVFQGRFPNGQQIAVKRLSQSSGQGAGEFKNEVLLVAKLQHRNLVRMLGFCLEGEEKLLVYEFVPKKSLDYFLFDPEKSRGLDWSRRYNIVCGIARGMLYLHEDSRLRIIHRDLKASNILLDNELNPKISDFGMARIVGVDETQANTNKIVGTFGYMSPEYAMHGQFSVKSDVYSFGVLLLELVTGKKNSFFYHSDGGEDLASYVWKNWRDGTPLEVLDPAIGDSYSGDEVLRCLNIGLLCVQEDPMDRPTMANIVLILSSYSVSLAMPQQPAFFLRSRTERPIKELDSDQSTSRSMPLSVNEMSVSEVDPR